MSARRVRLLPVELDVDGNGWLVFPDGYPGNRAQYLVDKKVAEWVGPTALDIIDATQRVINSDHVADSRFVLAETVASDPEIADRVFAMLQAKAKEAGRG